MKELAELAAPAEPSPGPEGLATPLLGLVVLAALILRGLFARHSGDKEPDE